MNDELKGEHNVNPATGRCVRCGRNEFNRRNQPICMTTGDYVEKWNGEANQQAESLPTKDELADQLRTRLQQAEAELRDKQYHISSLASQLQNAAGRIADRDAELAKVAKERDESDDECAKKALLDALEVKLSVWRNRVSSIRAMFPSDQAAERIEVCADELAQVLRDKGRIARTALDKLVAERVKEAVEKEREACAEIIESYCPAAKDVAHVSNGVRESIAAIRGRK